MTWETALRLTGTIARPRVMRQFDAAAACPVMLVVAPAGHGKSVAARQWLASRSGAAVWIDMRADGTRPHRFVTTLLQEVAATVDRPPPRTAGPDAPVEELLDDGIGELSRAEPVTLVLDRMDVAGEAVVALVRRLADGLPPSWQLLLTSRTTPDVGVARLRAALAIAIVDATDLRFDAAETAVLLRGSLGLDVDDDTLADLTRRLRGWPAGIMLAGTSALRRPDPRAALDAVTGRHPWIDEYLSAEVLPGLPSDLRDFLVRTAPLPRLSPDLCNAVTGRSDAAAQLEALRPWAGVTVDYTTTGAWSMLEPVFHAWLEAVALRTSADQVRRSRTTAARWLRDHGMHTDAVMASVAAGDPALVAELLAYHGYALARREPDVVTRAVTSMPADIVDAHPELWLLAADAAAAEGDGARATQRTDLARTAANGLTGGRADAVRRGVAMLDLTWYLRDGHVTEAGRLVSVLVPPVPERPRGAIMHAGWDADRARFLGDLTSYLMGAQHGGRSTAVRALVACHRGDPVEARALAWRALGGEGDVGDMTAPALAALALAWSGADADLARAARAGTGPTTPDWWFATCLRDLVAVEGARREHRWRTAHQHLARVQELLDEVPDPGPVPALLLVHAMSRLEGEAASVTPTLTERELLVLRHLARNESRREIAQRLHLSPNTVKTHLRSAYRKLGAASRREAVDRAQRMGVLDGAPSPASPAPATPSSGSSSKGEW